MGTGAKGTGDFPDVPQTLRRYGDMYQEWLAGIRQGDPDRPSCPFSYAGPLTAAYLLGNIAMKLEKTIEWDEKAPPGHQLPRGQPVSPARVPQRLGDLTPEPWCPGGLRSPTISPWVHPGTRALIRGVPSNSSTGCAIRRKTAVGMATVSQRSEMGRDQTA